MLFDTKIIRKEDYPFYRELHGKEYLREGKMVAWDADDLQSFTTTRFMPPELTSFKGRAVVVDPDVFAVGDVNDLFQRDMGGKAVMAKTRSGHKGYADYIATSVMLLDCSKLKHWNVEKDFRALFSGEKDYEVWMRLGYEPRETVGSLEDTWNDFDNLDANTKMIHNTKRRTQPWKTGLPVDFTNRGGLFGILPASWTPRRWIKRNKLPGSYWRHPDKRQEEYFFSLVSECLKSGSITQELLNKHMTLNHVRRDAVELAASARSVADILGDLGRKAA